MKKLSNLKDFYLQEYTLYKRISNSYIYCKYDMGMHIDPDEWTDRRDYYLSQAALYASLLRDDFHVGGLFNRLFVKT